MDQSTKLFVKAPTPTILKAEFVKKASAGRTILSDNPQTWESELTAQLFRQQPYLGKYRLSLEIDNHDAASGYMHGKFVAARIPDVPNMDAQMAQTGMPSDPETARMQAEQMAQLPSIRIPVIVEAKKAYPFDVMISPDGTFSPLTEERVAAALFTPNPYGVLSGGPGAGAEVNNFDPMLPSSAMGEGGYRGAVKTSSASLLKIAAAMDYDNLQQFVSDFEHDAGCMEHARYGASSFRNSLTKLAQMAAEERLVDPPTVPMPEEAPVLLEKVAGGYRATAITGDEVNTVMLPNSALEEADPSVKSAVNALGFVVVGGNIGEPLEERADLTKIASVQAEVPSTYRVLTKHASAEAAYLNVAVIPNVVDLHGRGVDGYLIMTPGGGTFMKEKLAGVFMNEGCDVMIDHDIEPEGYGFFVMPNGNVTTPFSVKTKVADMRNGAVYYLVDDGASGIAKVAFADVPKLFRAKDAVFVPADTVFVPALPVEGDPLVGDAQAMRGHSVKLAAHRAASLSYEEDTNSYAFGGVLADDESYGVELASLLLVHSGDTFTGALDKLARATTAPVHFYLPSEEPVVEPVTDIREALVEHISQYKRNLVKEAAEVASAVGPQTVDAMLSLNFITPESLAAFIEALPVFETAQAKLAELLIASRLGLRDVPEQALSSAVRGMERAIAGLKQLQLETTSSQLNTASGGV